MIVGFPLVLIGSVLATTRSRAADRDDPAPSSDVVGEVPAVTPG
jgi:hypothetical protein